MSKTAAFKFVSLSVYLSHEVVSHELSYGNWTTTSIWREDKNSCSNDPLDVALLNGFEWNYYYRLTFRILLIPAKKYSKLSQTAEIHYLDREDALKLTSVSILACNIWSFYDLRTYHHSNIRHFAYKMKICHIYIFTNNERFYNYCWSHYAESGRICCCSRYAWFYGMKRNLSGSLVARI